MVEFFNSTRIHSLVPPKVAIDALANVLRKGLDPEESSPRLFVDRPHGEFLIMPAHSGGYSGIPMSGVKVLTLTSSNRDIGMPPIHGLYILFDETTGAPVGVFEGAALTAIRTPATTVLGIQHLVQAQAVALGIANDLGIDRTMRVVVYGAGVQAEGHVRTMQAVFPKATFVICARTEANMNALRDKLSAEGFQVEASRTPDLAAADVVILATSSSTPVIGDVDVHSGLIIAAIGQHGLDARELQPETVLRSQVLLEGSTSALHENGNVTCLQQAGKWLRTPPVTLAETVRGIRTLQGPGPYIYTGVGMAWEDLAIAMVAYSMCSENAG
ncbi:ornithine cyclodeaminase family protein [Corynebacterium freiburgense]|uniref:ornithine cyclodeaminase family protein n=1 Tax=Corynebacterium freiburgense TaxID=556548 RepID=UPI0003FF6C2A|nr:ornithine cyclodeaminase family protein [Corynebacterium freiburgense]WJZ02620.1 ornithine cyclodeaminase [Corynebacterium freiburgense]